LRRIGGFSAIGDYLADDYQLGRRIRALGLRVVSLLRLSKPIWAAQTWGEVWRHQLRWSRGIRVSRPGGYFGYLVTHATFWSLVAIAGGAWPAGVAALADSPGSRASWVGWGVLRRSRFATPRLAGFPFATSGASPSGSAACAGNTVEWRGASAFASRSDGKIVSDL
jgi:ceramide glucosyltransferase